MQDDKAADILNFQVKRDIVSLYKRFLMMVEDLRTEHSSMLHKIEEQVPSEYHKVIKMCDYFNDEKFTQLRKRILDSGNESVRGIADQITQFEINFGA